LRLEIALHDPLLVRGFKRFRNLRPMGNLVDWNRALCNSVGEP
jgi:hypothetical protein